ncbi:hypothetical protein [Mycolicibacter sinensis]|uniref:hypothetical protein n=1 Tax=Mycolicibacter sinensis (strain JDM601) TaxID=875328 RepID=UPI000D694DB3
METVGHDDHRRRRGRTSGTVGTADDRLRTSVGPSTAPEVVVRGTPANLLRWLTGRRASTAVSMAGPAAPVQILRAFQGHV